jgi:prolipoprotein diacylglyceryltransferase
MTGGHYFVHRIDPILFTVAGVHFWWYGLSYTLGFFRSSAKRHPGLQHSWLYPEIDTRAPR